MIYFKVRSLSSTKSPSGAVTVWEKDFDDPESAIRAAMSYDHEREILMCDSQDPRNKHLLFAYIWLNKIHIDSIASSEFINAAKSVCCDWPYRIQNVATGRWI